jgi:hypothetical protein
MTKMSDPMAAYVCAVSIRVSPLLKELEEGEKLCTSAESLLAASSKLLRVLVLASKNIDVINFPCKAGIFFVPALLRDLNLSVNSKTDL